MVEGQFLSCTLRVHGGFRNCSRCGLSASITSRSFFLFGRHESLTGSEKDKETKGVISWMCSFLASCRCRVLVAGCVDLLEIFAKYKNKLEPADLHPDTVACAIADLKRSVRD